MTERVDPSLPTPLGGDLTIVDLSSGIAGAYCGKLLVDGGADVIKVEPPEGDPLRHRRLLDDPAPDINTGSVLFQFLALSKASVVADGEILGDRELVEKLVRGADAVIWSAGPGVGSREEFAPESLRRLAPRAVIVAITPFGLTNEPAAPVNEFTLQAMSAGGISRGRADREPLAVGGSYGDWIAGVFAAQGLLTAYTRARVTGVGELVDVSVLEALHLTQAEFFPTKLAATGVPPRTKRVRAIPGIHPSRDGYVGFQITTGQQWQDFTAMIGRPEWAEDPSLTRYIERIKRAREITTIVDEWTAERSTDDVCELAALFRLPVAPVANGETVPKLEQTVARGWYLQHPAGFTHPEVPYTFHGNVTRRAFGSPPKLGQDTAAARERTITPKLPTPTGITRSLPFEGLRIADFTAFWAGPIIGHYFAMLGADVIHVESPRRPDGYRNATLKHDMSEGWWEASPCFSATNTNKRDLAVDLSTAEGREIARALIAQSDVVIDNFSTRVMPQWGFDYESLRSIKPDLIVVRAPGFGLSGPWVDRLAYATTIEQASGVAFMTGFPDDRPDLGGGSMDSTAGTHAAFAIQLALEHRRRTGEGVLLEVPQFTTGINVCAEQVLEHSSSGRLLGRIANRSWTAAPQGSYRVLDAERPFADLPVDDWVAISVETDDQWLALCSLIGAEDLARDDTLCTVDGRRSEHDRIDEAITGWTRSRTAAEVVDAVRSVGIPCAPWLQMHELTTVPQLVDRKLYEMVEHPVMGTLPIITYPVHFESGPEEWHRRRAPLLGEHNAEILAELGYTVDQVDALEESGVIGRRVEASLAAW
ncbi:Crotonobetainyl-CoA:carnitine CoA-transferase CaiB [Pseudonocardia oroxyli]|uniref:Crotonobetainyl-CoA:carnitine CoA-transferase CaiB n=1 Tax=Pseudonocardia oroxyli TaxID=366584 RepID=A0A1G8DYF1_PSEOR|nr:Crotonobetainyl-CoA:carnitine CoA-transferase CaiB [Pseudonocardia oroxyli]